MDPAPSKWEFSQVFGEKSSQESTDADIVSAVAFDGTGKFLAAGDRGGRLVVFQRDEHGGKKKLPKYKFYVEFQSHEPEFDYLKSLEIEEKINKIRWVPKTNAAEFLLSTNDKTVKLWKIYEKNAQTMSLMDQESGKGLSVPRINNCEPIVSALPRRIYANAHAYHINSIALNSDGETYISSDDLRINLWNLEINNQSFNIVDIKPENMEELSEVITSAEFHPSHCNIFIYSSSKGSIKLGDLRDSALCDNQAKTFEEPEDPASRSFFSEIISSISDIKFSNDGRYILSRDYLTLRIWDINMESKPVKTIAIHDYLRSKLCDLYENDCIFDRFECVWNHNDSHILTGSYDNLFHIYDANSNQDTCIKASKSCLTSKHKKGKSKYKKPEKIDTESIDYNKKILDLACHPSENTVAVSACNNLYIYSAAGSKTS